MGRPAFRSRGPHGFGRTWEREDAGSRGLLRLGSAVWVFRPRRSDFRGASARLACMARGSEEKKTSRAAWAGPMAWEAAGAASMYMCSHRLRRGRLVEIDTGAHGAPVGNQRARHNGPGPTWLHRTACVVQCWTACGRANLSAGPASCQSVTRRTLKGGEGTRRAHHVIERHWKTSNRDALSSLGALDHLPLLSTESNLFKNV